MNDLPALSLVTDDIDDTCSCGSIYHSLSNTPIDECLPPPASLNSTPTSPKAKAFSVPELDVRAEKDQRSYEHSRQRLKKPEDIRKGKRCVRCRMCKPEKWAGNAGRPKRRDLRPSLIDAEGDDTPGSEDSIVLSEDRSEFSTALSPRVVTLADLVKPARKRSDKQFEIVGRPRQVLVMDEFTEVDCMNDFDDWEYVEKEHRRGTAAFLNGSTYARVVARV